MHIYNYQIQLQTKLCEVDNGDSVKWNESELVILRDEEFLMTAIEKATEFFKYSILPELLGKWYSKPPKSTVNSNIASSS